MYQQSIVQALQQQRLLLQIEYQTEKEAFRKQTEAMGIGRKVKRGDAWFPLRVGSSFYNSLNQMAVEVFRTTDQDITHNFEFGKPVLFFRMPNVGGTAKPRVTYFSFTGTVSYVDGDRMVVIVPEGHALDLQSCEEPIGAQLSFAATSHRTMFDALHRVTTATGNRLPRLRDLFYPDQPAPRFGFAPPSFP